MVFLKKLSVCQKELAEVWGLGITLVEDEEEEIKKQEEEEILSL